MEKMDLASFVDNFLYPSLVIATSFLIVIVIIIVGKEGLHSLLWFDLDTSS